MMRITPHVSALRLVLLTLAFGLITPGWSTPQIIKNADAAPVRQALNPLKSHPDLQNIQRLALILANGDRVTDGLPPMSIDPVLTQAAQYHAEDMLRRNYFSHYSPEGESPADRLAAAGRQGFPAENIAMTEDHRIRRVQPQTIETFQHQWMNSTGHRRNLMNPNYVRFGYGFAIDPGSGRVFAVQMFSRPS
jgi:uncharacterized protein YkwD